MCRVISVSNQKGGVGKTTTTLALSEGFRQKGFRVLSIDLDPQGNLSFSMGADNEISATIYDVLKGDAKSKFAIQRTPQGDVIASNILLSGIELEFTNTGREYLLRNAIAPLTEYYDYILIDTPPALSILTVNAFSASDCIVVPMLADIFSLQGLAQLNETVERVRQHINPSLHIAGILLTRFNPRLLMSHEIHGTAEMIARDLNIPLLKTYIRTSVVFSEAQSLQRGVMEYAPNSNAVEDYKNLVDELIERGI